MGDNGIDPVIKEIKEKLISFVHPERIILFGSYARGNHSARSDIDILVITRSRIALSHREFITGLFHDYPLKIDLLFYTQEELNEEQEKKYSFIRSALKNGITIHYDSIVQNNNIR
jgi:predicted nucleotidyltransferase